MNRTRLSQTSKSRWLMSTSSIVVAIVISSFAATPSKAAQDCSSLASLKVENTNLLSASEVPASGDLPAYCRVLGYVRPAINFEIRLPLHGWNGKLYLVGCGVYCGTLNTEAPGFFNAMNYGLRRNYVVSTSDTGHWGSNVLDARWAMNNPVALMDGRSDGSRNRACHQDCTEGLLRRRAAEILLRGLFDGRSHGPDGGSPLSERLRRDHRRCAGARLYRHCRESVRLGHESQHRAGR